MLCDLNTRKGVLSRLLGKAKAPDSLGDYNSACDSLADVLQARRALQSCFRTMYH